MFVFWKHLKKGIRIRLYRYKYIRPRRLWTVEDLKGKEQNIKAKLTEKSLSEIKSLWGRRANSHIKWFELYKTIWPNKPLKYFIPDDFYYMYIDDWFAKRTICKQIDDKNLYDLLFSDVVQPRTIARRMEGVFLSPDYQPISEEDIVNRCLSVNRIIIKQSVDSEGGKGIVFFDALSDPIEKLRVSIMPRDFIIQEVIKQHPDIDRIHPNSINTVRIITLFFEGNFQVLSSVLRMGVGEARVDNASSGGIVCGITSDGKLKNRAFDVKANCYYAHPSGVSFEGVQIPSFDECLRLCRKLAFRVLRYSKLISWDFAISPDGTPILIEVNLSYGQVDFHQMCNGPIFGDNTEKVLNYIINNNPFIN